MIVGRQEQILRIQEKLKSKRSEFIAVTGRRRIGKTFLIDTILGEHYCFSLTGIKDGDLTTQLINFNLKLNEYTQENHPQPNSWQEAFQSLKEYLEKSSSKKKQVIFIDEISWVSTARSGFLQMLAHFWNDYLSKKKKYILIICGSATSWIRHKIINDRGGLHNRVTEIIHLLPFTLKETKQFLESKKIKLTLQEITKFYLALGGIPFYLEQINRGESFAVAIERVCLSKNGILHNEYNNLFSALFNDHSTHESIIEVLSQKPNGMTKNEIAKKMGIKSSNGSFSRAVVDLEMSNFIMSSNNYQKIKRNAIYRVIDEYTVFYNRFFKNNKNQAKGAWNQLSQSQSYKIWSGYAFESICIKNIDAIKTKLGIAQVYTEQYAIKITPENGKSGSQIDLIIDRKDDTINLCEIKFYSGPFTITKDYYKKLLIKKTNFIEYTKTKKQVFITMICNYGLTSNMYSEEIIDSVISLEDLY